MLNNKGMSGIAIFFVVIAILLLGFIAFKLAVPNGLVIKDILEPKLSVSGVSFQSHFGLSQGCSTTVSGYVSNNGNANAEGVTVECGLAGSSGNVRGTKMIGSITAGSNSYFSIDVDNDCPKPSDAQCYATCSNCK